MYRRIARLWRALVTGSTFQLIFALIVGLATVLSLAPVASAGHESLYDRATHSHPDHPGKGNGKGNGNGKGPKNKTPAIVTTSGPLKGFVNGTTGEFLGIPYAAPPVGDLRWTPPQPYGQFKGLFDASSFGSQCTQPDGSGSENCLFLNIYVPNFKKNSDKHRGSAMPVMFWIHGGGLTSGAGSDYDPTPLLARGNVIVVTINYRLGYLGFFAESSLDSEGHDAGNYGLMDQQFAMQWVKDNIAAFGGDPSNVTIFGESAGGHSVYCNLASPTAAGLFSHAIAESGSYLIFDTFIQPIVPLSVGESTGNGLVPGGDTVASGFGCSDAACLRGLSNTALVGVEPGTLYAFVDGTLLTQTPAAAFASGSFNQVPVIAGTNHDEWNIFVAEQYDAVGNPILTMAEYDAATLALYGPALGPIVEAVYPYVAPGGQVLGESGTDGIFACSARNGDKLLSQFTTTYAYEFNDENAPPVPPIPGLTFPLGAFHGAELQYLFDVGFFFELNPAQLELSSAMVGYWTNFAASGNPNGGSLPTWSPYDPTADEFQSLIPPTPTVESNFNTDHLCDAFWNLIP
jgi:para-nitrobenzyl esterase